jgi:hypothetical protein
MGLEGRRREKVGKEGHIENMGLSRIRSWRGRYLERRRWNKR